MGCVPAAAVNAPTAEAEAAFAAVLARAIPGAEPPSSPPVVVVDFAGLPLLHAGEITFLYRHPKSGKSWATLAMAAIGGWPAKFRTRCLVAVAAAVSVVVVAPVVVAPVVVAPVVVAPVVVAPVVVALAEVVAG